MVSLKNMIWVKVKVRVRNCSEGRGLETACPWHRRRIAQRTVQPMPPAVIMRLGLATRPRHRPLNLGLGADLGLSVGLQLGLGLEALRIGLGLGLGVRVMIQLRILGLS